MITVEVCKRSGTDTASCGLAACDNGCDVAYIECVPAEVVRECFEPIGGPIDAFTGEIEPGDAIRILLRVSRVLEGRDPIEEDQI